MNTSRYSSDENPGYTFGDLPQGTIFTPQGFSEYAGATKTGEQSWQKTLFSSAPNRGTRMEGKLSLDHPIQSHIPPSPEKISANLREQLNGAVFGIQFPLGMSAIVRANRMLRSYNASGTSPVQGPFHNPCDRIRTEVNLQQLPRYSVFTTDTIVRPESPVYFKESNGHHQCLGTYSQWQSGEFTYDTSLLAPKAEVNTAPEGTVTALFIMTPEELQKEMATAAPGKPIPPHIGDGITEYWQNAPSTEQAA